MTKPQDYTVKQFTSEIRTIIETNPDKVNAFAEAANGIPGSCVYENQQGDHCIIGEFLSSIDLLDSLPWSGFEDDNGMKECINISPKPLPLSSERMMIPNSASRLSGSIMARTTPNVCSTPLASFPMATIAISRA